LNDDDLTADVVKKFLEAVRDDGRVFFTPTVLRGVPAIRAAISNWLTKREDVALAFEVINSVNQKLKRVQSA